MRFATPSPHLFVSPKALIVWPTEVQFSKVSPGFPHCFVSLSVHSKGHLPRIWVKNWTTWYDFASTYLGSGTSTESSACRTKITPVKGFRKEKKIETTWLSRTHGCHGRNWTSKERVRQLNRRFEPSLQSSGNSGTAWYSSTVQKPNYTSRSVEQGIFH